MLLFGSGLALNNIIDVQKAWFIIISFAVFCITSQNILISVGSKYSNRTDTFDTQQKVKNLLLQMQNHT